MQRKARTVGILVHQQRRGEVQQVCNAHDQQPHRLQAPRSRLHAARELSLDNLSSGVTQWLLSRTENGRPCLVIGVEQVPAPVLAWPRVWRSKLGPAATVLLLRKLAPIQEGRRTHNHQRASKHQSLHAY